MLIAMLAHLTALAQLAGLAFLVLCFSEVVDDAEHNINIFNNIFSLALLAWANHISTILPLNYGGS